jgi:hypothetical protein
VHFAGGAKIIAASNDNGMFDHPGNPAVIGPIALKPVALRPRLSTGLPGTKVMDSYKLGNVSRVRHAQFCDVFDTCKTMENAATNGQT